MLALITTVYVVLGERFEAGVNVIVVFAEFQENEPFAGGVMENAFSTLPVFMLSLNVIVITEFTGTPVPVGEWETTVGGVLSASVLKFQEYGDPVIPELSV